MLFLPDLSSGSNTEDQVPYFFDYSAFINHSHGLYDIFDDLEDKGFYDYDTERQEEEERKKMEYQQQKKEQKKMEE